MAWFGKIDAVNYYLSSAGADKGMDGRYLVAGAPVGVGLDPGEVIVPDETVYFVAGRPRPLAAGLGSSSMGMGGAHLVDGTRTNNPASPRHLQLALLAIQHGATDLHAAIGLQAAALMNRDMKQGAKDLRAACEHAYVALGAFNLGLVELGHTDKFVKGTPEESRFATLLGVGSTGRRLAELTLQRAMCGPPGVDEEYAPEWKPSDRVYLASLAEYQEALPKEWAAASSASAKTIRTTMAKLGQDAPKRGVQNPPSDPRTVVDAVKAWLEEQDLASSSIRFLTPKEWNDLGYDTQVDRGFVIVAEGTNFNHMLAGYGGPEWQEVYDAFSRLLADHGWWHEDITCWAFHILPRVGKAKLENPASTDYLEQYTPAQLKAMPSISSSQFDELKVDDGRHRWWLTRLTPADGAKFRVSVEEYLPAVGRWEVVHQYGRFGRSRAGNPNAATHRANFDGAMKTAQRQLDQAFIAYGNSDLAKARRHLEHAECDVRQAYIEATYATRGQDDPDLARMAARVYAVYQQVQRLRGHATIRQNPDTGTHYQEMATRLDRAQQMVDEAQEQATANNLPAVFQLAGQAEAEAMMARLQIEYLMQHAGEQVPFPTGGIADIPDRQTLEQLFAHVSHLGRTANHLFLNSLCAKPHPWVLGEGGRRMVH